MPYQKLEIPGGIIKDRSAYSTGGRWVDGDKVRFQQGFPELIGGWIEEDTWEAVGEPNNATAWSNLAGDQLLAIGTQKKIQLVFNDTMYDITPLRETQSLTNPFTTVDESAVVTVADTGHGAANGDYVTFSGASANGGITISGEYVLTYVDDNTFTITHSSAATSGATGGGSVTAKYQISTGVSSGTAGLGWGIGTWNGYREGTPITQKTITGITQANPGVVTSNGHGFSNGDKVLLESVVGMTEVNAKQFTISGASTNTFQLDGIDSTSYTTYSSAGKCAVAPALGEIVSFTGTNTYTNNAYPPTDVWRQAECDRGECAQEDVGTRRPVSYYGGAGTGEIIYGVEKTATANDKKVLGAYLFQTPDKPDLAAAVGNYDIWVVDKGANIAVGDWLISSDVAGHAMRDDGTTYSTAYVFAMSTENVDWSTVTDTVSGTSTKKKKISVLFERFVRN